MRLWRTQVHFLADVKDDQVIFELPGWDHSLDGSHEVVVRQAYTLPPEVVARVRKDYRCHVRTNLSATKPSELRFEDWELS